MRIAQAAAIGLFLGLGWTAHAAAQSPGYDYWPVIDDTNPAVVIDTPMSTAMFDFQNRQGDKHTLVLANKLLYPETPTLILGGQVRASMLAAGTNTADKFPYLGRFPPDFVGESASDARVVHANFGGVGHVNSWASVYFETLYSDVFTFPTFNQGSFQVRQAYAVFGDLEVTPWYAFVGKKNVSFGDMGTLSPFSQSVVWHYFGALAEGLGVGYVNDGWNVCVTGLNGGRGIRVADSESRGLINNFAANALYSFTNDADREFRVGAGYLHGTIYDAAVAEHIDPNLFGDLNGAWDVNALLRLGQWSFAGEYVSTLNAWPATGARVQAWRTEAAYQSCIHGRPASYSVGYSEGLQGPSGSEFEFNQQLVLGLGVDLTPNAKLTLEYVRSMGFAPLINITTASDRSVAQDTVVAGLVLVL